VKTDDAGGQNAIIKIRYPLGYKNCAGRYSPQIVSWAKFSEVENDSGRRSSCQLLRLAGDERYHGELLSPANRTQIELHEIPPFVLSNEALRATLSPSGPHYQLLIFS
jgi:hypothetical protein